MIQRTVKKKIRTLYQTSISVNVDVECNEVIQLPSVLSMRFLFYCSAGYTFVKKPLQNIDLLLFIYLFNVTSTTKEINMNEFNIEFYNFHETSHK